MLDLWSCFAEDFLRVALGAETCSSLILVVMNYVVSSSFAG